MKFSGDQRCKTSCRINEVMLLFVRQKQYVGPLNRVDHLKPACMRAFFLRAQIVQLGRMLTLRLAA